MDKSLHRRAMEGSDRVMTKAGVQDRIRTGRFRVLVVDDDPFVREIAGEILRGAGYDVGTAVDGIEGAWKFLRGEWDVVIADRMMPRLSGEEMTAAIKIEAPDVPVILLTGIVRNVQHPECYAAALTKPFMPEALLGAMREVLREHFPDAPLPDGGE